MRGGVPPAGDPPDTAAPSTVCRDDARPMKVLVSIFSDNVTWNIPEAHVERLRQRFPQIAFANARNEEDVLREIADAEAAFTWKLTPEQLGAARRLLWVHSPAAGVGGLLFREMRACPVLITNSRGIHAEPIAEHVTGVTIALFRGLHRALLRQRERVWAQQELWTARTVRGRRMGLVGLGAIGSAIARSAVALGMRVSAVRRNPDAPAPEGVEAVYPPSRLAELLGWSDVVVLATPLTPATRGLVGRAELRVMKREAFLVNISRGKVIREQELIAELLAGTIAGAALDVFEREPLDASSPLWNLPNVIITPHTSGFREDYWDRAVELFEQNLGSFTKGGTLVNQVDKAAGY
jgi:phosphoglycerate dehydrogenase-like enzyme